MNHKHRAVLLGGLLFFTTSISANELASCLAGIVDTYPQDEAGFGCDENLEYQTDWIKRGDEYLVLDKNLRYARCHFDNRYTLYLYELAGQSYMDIRGEEGRAVSTDLPPTQSFSRCEALKVAVADYQAKPTIEPDFADTNRRPLISQESILLVASIANCELLGPELNLLLSHYHAEGRSHSDLLCLESVLIKQKNPSVIRSAIHKQLANKPISGVMLIGTDIPPFEMFYRTTNSTTHGHTDLPYGNIGFPLWDNPIAKQSARLKNKIYFDSDNHIYKTMTPSEYAFDATNFKNIHGHVYQQHYWVTRWLPRYTDAMLVKQEFYEFVIRRLQYLAPTAHRLLHLSEYRRITLGRLETAQAEENLAVYLDSAPGAQGRYFVNTDFYLMLRNMPKNTTVLTLDSHGNGTTAGTVDAMNYYRFEHLTNWPEIVLLANCLNGMWGMHEFNDGNQYQGTLLAAGVLGTSHNTLLVIASQLSTAFAYMGKPSEFQRTTFFADVKKGQSFGARQIGVVNINAQHYITQYHDGRFDRIGNWQPDKFLASLYQDLLASVSLFGDASLEF